MSTDPVKQSAGSFFKALVPIVIGFIVFLIGYFIYRKFFSPAKRAELLQEVESFESSKMVMENGRTYFSVADEIYNHLYWERWIFSSFMFKNTNEEALGNLMLTVRQSEFNRLSEVYLAIKKALKNAANEPLTEDLLRTFNNKERAMYLSHLINL